MKTKVAAKPSISRCVCILVFLSLAAPGSFAEVRYSVTDLGRGIAYGINNNGQVVGESYFNGDEYSHAFLYSRGQITDLGKLGGYLSSAYSINDNGQIVGMWSIISSSHTIQQMPFLYDGTGMHDLETRLGTGNFYCINNNGWISGIADSLGGFLYDGTTVTALNMSVRGLNSHGDVTGYAQIQTGVGWYTVPCLYVGGVYTYLGSSSGGINNIAGAAYAINDQRQVVGSSYTQQGNSYHAFLYSGGIMTDLGTLGGSGSTALGLNNTGQVVGNAAKSGSQHAFLYSDGAMTDLNDLINTNFGWTLQHAYAINDNGQIVGQGINSSGQREAFLLTPIPEPTSLSLLALGVAVMLFRRKSVI